MKTVPLIFAQELDGRGGAIQHDDIAAAKMIDRPIWFHFDANHENAKQVIHESFSDIDEFSIDAIFTPDARPRTLQLDHGTLIILRGVNYNDGESLEDMIAVRLWVTENRIISLRYRKSKAVMQAAENLRLGRGAKSIGDVVALITSRLFSHMETTISQLSDDMDLMESRVLDTPDKQLRKDISEIRKTAILLRRHIAPQKEAMVQLRYSDLDWLNKTSLRRLQESQDLLLRCIEELDAVRERSQIVKDELVNTLSDRLNRNLYVISVITAIFLPLGFLTGLFGINIGGMPGVDQENAFALFALSLTIIVFIQVILFKLFKWF